MRLFPFPRRHRVLWIVAALLGVSAWGSWLVATDRTPDYANGFVEIPVTSTVPAPVTRQPGVHDVADLFVTPSSGVPGPTTAAARVAASVSNLAAAPTTSARQTASTASRAAVSSLAGLAGMTDPLIFVGVVADTVLTYEPGLDFATRADTVMAVAALPPIGSPAELLTDLNKFAPNPVVAYGAATVTFAADSVQPSPWAATRLNRLKLPAESFAIDVTGHQLITLPGHSPVSVTVTLGVTGACPPALSQCEIDRIFPRTISQELGS